MVGAAALIAAKLEWERSRRQMEAAIDPKAEQKALARNGLLDFTCYTMPSYEVNWHHAAFCRWIEKMLQGECDRLMILVPPRHGKSEIVSRRLPAYILGQNPDEQIIACSYSADLASRLNRDVQRIIDSEPYAELFQNTRLNSRNVATSARGNYLRNSEIFEIVGHKGSYRSAGIGGGITGMGFSLGVIDDPIKNREEAESKTIRDGVWEWYTSTFRTRAEKGAKILIVLTAWHDDDLRGRLLKTARENPKADQWTVVKFPAIATQDIHADDTRQSGEALWVGKYPLEELERIQASIGPYDWASLYQCSPTREGGNLFSVHWFRYWVQLPQKFDRVILSLHSKFKETTSASYASLQVWGKAGDTFYLIDQVRDRLSYLAVKELIGEIVSKWSDRGITINELFVEEKINGKAVLEGLSATCPVTVSPTSFAGDTESGRAQAITGFFQEGQICIPTTSEAPWVDGFVQELTDFPNAETSDQTGATTQALIYLALRDTTGKPYRYFNRLAHGLKGQDAIDMGYDPELDLHLSFDWNRSPACAIVGQVRDRELFTLREFYLMDSDTFQLTEAVGRWIISLGHQRGIYVYGDASGNQRRAEARETNWQIFWSTFKRLELKHLCHRRYKDANPPVRERVASVNRLFMLQRSWINLDTCPQLVQDFEVLRWKNGDIDKSDILRSHLSDAYGYLVHTLFPYRNQEIEKRGPQRRVPGVVS